jgi:hypothetical protein
LRVLDDLGSTLLEVLAGQVATARDITAMTIYDPAEPLVVPAGAVVLGVRNAIGVLVDSATGTSARNSSTGLGRSAA